VAVPKLYNPNTIYYCLLYLQAEFNFKGWGWGWGWGWGRTGEYEGKLKEIRHPSPVEKVPLAMREN